MSSVNWVKSQLKHSQTAIQHLQNDIKGGHRFLLCSHLEPKLAALGVLLKDAGFQVTCISNLPTSVKADAVKSLQENNVEVIDTSNLSFAQSEERLSQLLNEKNFDFTFDDGAHTPLKEIKNSGSRIVSEFTQSGINLVKENKQRLNATVFNLNSSFAKSIIGNLYGTGASTLTTIQHLTNSYFRGKKVGIIGFGPVGKGCAKEFTNVGETVFVHDTNKALSSDKFGIEFTSKQTLLQNADLIITCTGREKIITDEDIQNIKDGAILANVGHYNYELYFSNKVERRQIEDDITELKYKGKTLYLLCEGNLVNLAAGNGYPIEIIDYSFAASIYGFGHFYRKNTTGNNFYDYPTELDRQYFENAFEIYPSWENL